VGKEPDEIRREIEDTRSRMTETVEAIGYKADVPARARESVQNVQHKVSGKVRDAKDRVVGSVVGTKESMGESMSNVGGSISDAGGRVSEGFSNATPSAEQMKAGIRRTAGLAQDNPAGLAVGAIAFGFLAGLMVPATRTERERLGPIATEAKEKVRETGQEAMERGREVATQAVGAAKEVAQETAQNVHGQVQEQAQQLKDSATEQGQELASSAQENAQDVAASAQHQGEDLKLEVQDKASRP
jgi:gas vesicle protein